MTRNDEPADAPLPHGPARELRDVLPGPDLPATGGERPEAQRECPPDCRCESCLVRAIYALPPGGQNTVCRYVGAKVSHDDRLRHLYWEALSNWEVGTTAMAGDATWWCAQCQARTPISDDYVDPAACIPMPRCEVCGHTLEVRDPETSPLSDDVMDACDCCRPEGPVEGPAQTAGIRYDDLPSPSAEQRLASTWPWCRVCNAPAPGLSMLRHGFAMCTRCGYQVGLHDVAPSGADQGNVIMPGRWQCDGGCSGVHSWEVVMPGGGKFECSTCGGSVTWAVWDPSGEHKPSDAQTTASPPVGLRCDCGKCANPQPCPHGLATCHGPKSKEALEAIHGH